MWYIVCLLYVHTSYAGASTSCDVPELSSITQPSTAFTHISSSSDDDRLLLTTAAIIAIMTVVVLFSMRAAKLLLREKQSPTKLVSTKTSHGQG